jgi:hypothetical protein
MTTRNLSNVNVGDNVTIIKGGYRGEIGHFVRWAPYSIPFRKSAYVHLGCHIHPNESTCVRTDSIRFDALDGVAVNMQIDARATTPMANAIVIDTIHNNQQIVTVEQMEERIRLIGVSFNALYVSHEHLTARVAELEQIAVNNINNNNNNGTSNTTNNNRSIVVEDDAL